MFRQAPGGREELDPQSGLRFVGTLSVFTDIRELKRAEQAIQHRLAAEELMAGISTRFINTPPAQVDREIERALEAAGGFAGVERVFLAFVADDGVTIRRRYSWRAPATGAGDDAAAPLSLSDYPWAREKVLCGQPIYIARTSALPQEAAAEKAYLRALGVEATLGVPLMHEQRLAALMGFHSQREERKWSEEDANLLRLLGEILLNALARQQAQEQIALSLREKDILLKEVHHRVNNNLQVICSLLDLQAGATADSQATQAFAQTRNRIHAMALVHEKIYRSKELGRVEAVDTIEDLTRNLYAVYGPGREDISLAVRADHVVLDLDAAIPLALVINELISNAVRHAFPAGWDAERGEAGCRAELRVELHHEPAPDRIVLCVSDNGVGLPPGYDWRTASSLGLQLVRMLTEQLEGTAEVSGDAGVCVSIAFPAGGSEERVRCRREAGGQRGRGEA
jgi:two-component sensor histidine kinase